VGGFTAVQKEVVAILSSPTVTEDVRTSGFSILSRLGAAIAADRATEAEAKAKTQAENEKEAKKRAEKEKDKDKGKGKGKGKQEDSLDPPPPYSSTDSPPSRPSLKRFPSSAVSTLLRNLTETRDGREDRARKGSKQAAKQAKLASKDAASWELVSIEEDVAAGKVLSSAAAPEHKRVCVHGLFMGERRHFEVRERDGKLTLVDGNTGEVVAG